MRAFNLLAAVAFSVASAIAADEVTPATPMDAAELFAVYKVVPGGGAGTREISKLPGQVLPKGEDKLHVAIKPVLTLRDGLGPRFADAYEAFLKSEQGRAYAPGRQSLKGDGSFRIERVPTAKYWIYVHTDGAKAGTRAKTLHMKLLPGGKSDLALELGEIQLHDRGASPF